MELQRQILWMRQGSRRNITGSGSGSKSGSESVTVDCTVTGTERVTVLGRLLEKGISIDKVASFVGHSDLGTTKAYNKRKSTLEKSLSFELDF